MTDNHNISDVARLAGIPKDLLRMWERRYGYPAPARNSNGDRVYSDEHIDKLTLIRQLLNQGMRPGKLMALSVTDLESLLEKPKPEVDTDVLMTLLKSAPAAALQDWLEKQLRVQGLRAFIHQVLAPAIRSVGEDWARGELEIHQEHLFTETVKNLLRQALKEHHAEAGRPRVLLTTVPGEQHSLGLLMVEALLRLGGAEAVSFGTEMPSRDVMEAARSHGVDIIGLSFSGSFKTDDAIVMLSGLRQMIDPRIRIWAGGAALESASLIPEGVECLDGLPGVERALASWRSISPDEARQRQV